MRVIAGEAKGHRLKSVKSSRLRPTSSIVKSALFSILESSGLKEPVLLDLYAGTGALGIEALSRGVRWVDFVEENHRCCSIIRENLASTNLDTRSHVYCASVNRALSFLERDYDIIIMDPPYKNTNIEFIIEKVANSKAVKTGTRLIILHSSHLPLAPSYGKMHLINDRKHGDTTISIYQQKEEVP